VYTVRRSAVTGSALRGNSLLSGQWISPHNLTLCPMGRLERIGRGRVWRSPAGPLDSVAPVCIHLVHGFLHLWIAFAAQGKLLQHQQHFRMVFEVVPAIGKLLAQAVKGRKSGRAGRPAMEGDKFCTNQLGQPFDKVLLGGKVIVQGGNVHSGAIGNRAGT